SVCLPWHFLYFVPLPRGQGSFLPILGPTFTGSCFTAVPVSAPPGSKRSLSLAPYSFPADSTASLFARNLLRSVFSCFPSRSIGCLGPPGACDPEEVPDPS